MEESSILYISPFYIPHKNFQPLGFVEGISIFNVV